MKSVVSTKGQVTIPRVLRDRLGILPGQVLDLVEEDGALVARIVTQVDPVDETFGIISMPAGTDAYLAGLRDLQSVKLAEELLDLQAYGQGRLATKDLAVTDIPALTSRILKNAD